MAIALANELLPLKSSVPGLFFVSEPGPEIFPDTVSGLVELLVMIRLLLSVMGMASVSPPLEASWVSEEGLWRLSNVSAPPLGARV